MQEWVSAKKGIEKLNYLCLLIHLSSLCFAVATCCFILIFKTCIWIFSYNTVMFWEVCQWIWIRKKRRKRESKRDMKRMLLREITLFCKRQYIFNLFTTFCRFYLFSIFALSFLCNWWEFPVAIITVFKKENEEINAVINNDPEQCYGVP